MSDWLKEMKYLVIKYPIEANSELGMADAVDVPSVFLAAWVPQPHW